MSNLEVLKKGYQDFAAGNIEAAITDWSKEIVWEQCIGFPYVKDGGKYVGVQSVVADVLMKVPELYENFNIEISNFVNGGNRIGYYLGTWKETGKKFKANATHTWTFKDRKAVHFFQAVDTAAIINP